MSEEPRPEAVAVGRIVHAFLRAGWNPPVPNDRILGRFLDDAIRVGTPTDSPRLPNGRWSSRPTLRLSIAEKEVLTLYALGYNSVDQTSMSRRTVNTVKYHLKSCRRKLGARSTAHAVTLAIEAGMISPKEEEARRSSNKKEAHSAREPN